MVVAIPRRFNPYGPPSPFGSEMNDQYAPPSVWPGIGEVDQYQQPVIWPGGVGAGAGVGAPDGTTTPTNGQDPMFEPAPKAPGMTGDTGSGVGGPASGDAPDGDYVSEAAIERRLRLAKALMGQQQEVNHPLQAVGNAVNQIAGAYLENKAGRDQEAIEKRRRDAYKKAFGTGSSPDLNAVADELLRSDDPELVDKGLAIKMQLATGQRRSRNSPVVRDFQVGDQVVPHQWDEETGQWKPIEGAGGPRWRDNEGGGSGGSGGGEGPRRQQGGAFQLPDGDVVAANFNPADGQYYYKDNNGQMVPVPAGSRPVNPSTGGSQTPAGFYKLKKERQEGINALKAIQEYAKIAGGLPQGFRRWANDLSAKWKTFLDSQGLTQAEFDQLDANAKQQALLGMLRTTIVGPGVMTEYDAQRIIEAMGGNPGSAMQNPEVLAKILADLYERKYREVSVMDEEYRRNARTFGEEPEPMDVPPSIREERPDGGSAPRKAKTPEGLPPPDKRPKGTRVTKNGKTYEWNGTGWREVK